MTMRSTLPYVGAATSAALYAWWVESRPRKYHPDVTWPNVLGGVALTGFWVAVRYAAEPEPRSLHWAWMVTFQMFWATGLPVVAWEELAKDGRYRALIAYLRGEHRRDQATPAGEPSGRAG
jgi:hypothetical protein